MLTVLLGTDWVANREEILRLVAQDVQQNKNNRILMVPELISHDTERRLCAAAGDTASRFAEVLSFSRLVRRVCDSIGLPPQPCLDNGGRIVAMAAAARQLHSKLKAYGSVETRPEFLTGLVEAVDEFKRCCITARDLMRASKQTEGGFAQKLEELSLLLEAYDSLCSRGKRDPRDQMTWLLEQMEETDFARDHVFYIDGFPDFTRQHTAILEHLIVHAAQVVVSINCDRPGSRSLAFEKAGETASSLIRFAKEAGIACDIRIVEPMPSPLNILREGLFQGSAQHDPELQGRLFVCQAQSVQQECELAAKRILQLVRAGCRFRDIGVVCTDMAAYRNTLKMMFHRCQIPVYQSGTEEVLGRTVISTVLSAMDAALGGFERQDVMRYIKSSLSPLSLDEADLVENYTYLWGISGSSWLSEWKNHPNGLGLDFTDSSRAKLEMLNYARAKIVEPLDALKKRFHDASDVRGQVMAICQFFEEIGLAKRLSRLADQLDASGDNRSAQILNQLWEILLSALEQLYDVLGETVWDAPTFTRLFMLLLGQYDVGTIPPVLDAVHVGPVSAMRCQQLEHLIVLGAQEGALPSYGGSSGVLTDQERDALRSMGITLTGGSMEGLQAEFAEIYGVFCGARTSVMVTCGSGQPSFVYRRLLTMAGGEADFSGLAACDAKDAAAVLARLCDEAAAKKLGIIDEYRQISCRKSYALGEVSRSNIEAIYGKKLNLSASQVDRQAECRFSYFLRYGLRAQERKEAAVDPAEFGTYVHAVLECTARDVMSMGGFHEVSLEKTMEIAMKHSDDYASKHFAQLDSQRMTYLFARNIQELAMVVEELWQELHSSLFEPVGFEVNFDDGQEMPAIHVPGKTMDAQLRGFVDRVDAWLRGDARYFRVVDYKTGRKDFDYCDVFNGIGLQMLLYMFALEQGGEALLGRDPQSAGVQYFPARSPLLSANGRLTDEEASKERGKSWRRRGLVLSDQEVLEAMEPEGSPSRLSCKLTKDGEVTGDIATGSQLKILKQYVFAVVGKMVDDIAAGKVAPNPYTRGNSHNACSFCPYKTVCHYACVEERRNYRAMSAQLFWDEIEKEVADHG